MRAGALAMEFENKGFLELSGVDTVMCGVERQMVSVEITWVVPLAILAPIDIRPMLFQQKVQPPVLSYALDTFPTVGLEVPVPHACGESVPLPQSDHSFKVYAPGGVHPRPIFDRKPDAIIPTLAHDSTFFFF